MKRAWVIHFLALVGCVTGGSVPSGDAGSSDATPDALPLPKCDPTAPFVRRRVLDALAQSGDQDAVTLYDDERRILVGWSPLLEAGAANAHIYELRRVDRSQDFPTLTNATYVPSLVNRGAYQVWPSITRDGKSLYFVGPSTSSVVVSQRASIDDPFGVPQPLPNIVSGAESPYVRPDGEELYFSAASGSTMAIFVSKREFGALQVASEITVITQTLGLGLHPVISDDGLTLYLSDGSNKLRRAQRPSTSASFGAPVEQPGKFDYGEFPIWISPDACRLYSSSKVGGTYPTGSHVVLSERDP